MILTSWVLEEGETYCQLFRAGEVSETGWCNANLLCSREKEPTLADWTPNTGQRTSIVAYTTHIQLRATNEPILNEKTELQQTATSTKPSLLSAIRQGNIHIPNLT